MQLRYQMKDILPLLPIPQPPQGKTSYNIPCPICEAPGSGKRHLNINLKKNVFCCPKCGRFSGGVLDLYAFYEGLPRRKAYRQLQARLEGQGTYVYHRSEAERPKAAPPPENPEAALADADTRHRVYTALLTRLQLAPDHRENLLGRGLVDDEITRLQYRTAPTSGLADLAAALEGEGCSPLGGPGFYRDRQGQWTLASYRRGILIPCRDRFGRIQSLHVRLDKELKRGGKFLTFSSPDKRDGCGAQNWCHMAGPVQPEILLIEGYMKADIVHYFTGQTVLAIPGVTSIQHLESVLKELIGLGVKHVMTCFDMDYMRNWHVEGAYGKLREMLGGLNLTFGTYVWDPAYNGLDDYIWQFWMNKGELSHESLEKA